MLLNNTMQTFEYPLFFKILYRFGNIPVTVLLIIYLVVSVTNLDRDLLYIIPVIITLSLLYFINRHYLFLYQLLPYKIIADDEKLICTDFLFRSKEVVIHYQDIESLSGGIFSGRLRGLMKVCNGKSKICIGFYDKIKNVIDLQTIILSRINKDVYDKVVESVGLRKQ